MASKIAWIPADDLLLKNAVEDGASLEALAKGAVRFSRRFTFQELQDRWHSLLYDPHISAEASARMVEFEQSSSNNAPKFSRLGNVKVNVEVSLKRKVESIRRMYYAMRKRIRSQPLDANGIGSLSPYLPNLNRCNGNGDEGGSDGHMLVKSEEPAGILHGDCNLSSIQSCEIAGDVMRPSGTVADISLTDNLNVKTLSNSEFMYEDSANVCLGYGKQPFNSPVSDRDTPLNSAGFSDCLLNIANDSPLLFIDEDANTAIGTYDNLNSLLLSSPNQSHEECLPDHCEPDNKVESVGVCLEITKDSSQAMLDVTESAAQSAHDSLHSDVNVPSSSSGLKPPFPEFRDDFLVCSLNTEDPEVPSNDDIFPLGEFTIAVPPLNLGMISEPTFHFRNQDDGDHECLKGISPGESCLTSQNTKGFKRLRGTGPYHHSLAGQGKAKLSDGTYPDAPCRHPKNVYLESGPSKSGICTLGPLKGELQGSDSLAIIAECPPFHEDSDLMGVAFPEAALKPTTSKNEAYESDEDVPCFSDVEALILEMDLCAHDQQLVSTAVSKYQHENVKKSIIKLEQCARSSQQRGMTSQGALAIFYGRRLKYYIRKTQVILGRATEDTDVDIDLGKEGPANKISRRQAIIKMDKDGSFVLRNVGKIAISVNGKEIMKGQLLVLGSSCLIEIREMRFVFEVNHKFVKQYLLNVGKPKNATFDWVPEGGLR